MAAGLSVSLAFVIIMSCFVWQSLSVNRYYSDQNRMYAIGGKGTIYSNKVMAQTMEDAIPDIESSTTVGYASMENTFIVGTEIPVESGLIVFTEFFDLFPTAFVEGDIHLFNDTSNALITRTFAEKHKDIDLIGKKFHFDGHNGTVEVIIAGIIEGFEDTIFDNAEVVLNRSHTVFNENDQNSNLHGLASGTYSIIKVKEGTDENELLYQMERVYEKDLPENRRQDSYLSLTRLDHIYTSDNNPGHSQGFKKGNSGLMTAFSIIVAFLLISAIFNYINLSTALAGRRSKETATRMLLGEDRKSIFIRSLSESLSFMAVCMALAFILAHLFIPYVNRLIDSPIPVQMKFTHGYIYMYLLILGITALFCSITPAVITFRFKPIEIIKGQYRYKNKRTFSKIFIILQNVIAVIIIAVTLIMNGQIRHMIDMPLNTGTDGIYIGSTYTADFAKTLSELPYVEKFGRAMGRPGQNYATMGFILKDDINKQVKVNLCHCDSTAFETFGFKIVKDYGLPNGVGAWITESAVRKLEIDQRNPVFPQHALWVIDYGEIAGIIEDVPFSPALNLEPDVSGIVIKGPQDPEWSDYIIILNDSSPENISELDRLCKEEIKKAFGPNAPMMSGYWQDLIEKTYEPLRKQNKMVTIFMIIAIVLSALGQIAMSTYYATEKEKEIGIRKVFGGTVRSESIRNIREYLIYCLIACTVAVPLAVWIGGRYLETFVYKMQMRPWLFISAVLAAFATSFASVLWQTLRAARTNPADVLKKE